MENIIKTVSCYFSADANKYLKIGWILLATAPGRDEEGYPTVLYSLGWSKELGEVREP